MTELPKLNIIKKKSNYDISKLYNQYCEDVLNDNITANKWIKLACKRYKSWFDRDDIWFDEADVDLKIRFMQKMKHSKGEFEGQNFILYPYQAWIVANIVGWKHQDTNERVINTALLMLSRKAGKTFFASALLLAIILTDKERGAEGYMIANSSQQAGIAFSHAKDQCSSLDPNGKIFSRYRSQIRINLLNSSIQILSAETSRLDGLSPSVFIVDEYHASKTAENYNILRTGQGARKNPLGIIISSAGFLLGPEYPLYAEWENATDVLQGTKRQDTLFAAIYQLDVDDQWDDESCWIKANPTLGGSISYKFLREQVEQAKNNPSQEVSIKTKNFNIWCSSEVTWIPREDLLAHTEKFDINFFKDDEYYCYGGVDLGSISDMTAVAFMVKKNDKYYFKCYMYIPQGALNKSKNQDLYHKWIKEGYLKVTNSERMNYEEVVGDILEFNKDIPIYEIAYDAYNASTFTRSCSEEGLVMTRFSQTKGNFNLATKEFERRLYNGDIVIDDNPIIRWCFANAMLEYDKFENCKPVKGSGSLNKIDAVIAILEAFGTYMNREEKQGGISVI